MIPRGYSKSVWSMPAQSPLAPPPDSYGVLFGSALRAFFHVGAGTSLAANGGLEAFTDQASAITATATASDARPTLLPDGSNFYGRPVVDTYSAAMQSAPVNFIGRRPQMYTFALCRVREYTAGGHAVTIFAVTRPGGFESPADIRLTTTGLGVYSAGAICSYATSDTTSVMLLECVRASDVRFYVNGTLVSTAALSSGFAAVSAVQFGLNGVGAVYPAGVKLAMAGMVNPNPTDAQRARLLELARWEWGF